MKTSGWTPVLAKKWLKAHNFIPIKRVHTLGYELRYRIKLPIYSRYITKKIDDRGIYFVIGF